MPLTERQKAAAAKWGAPMTRVYIEILLHDGLAASDGNGSVLQRSEIILKPDERRRATIFFGEPSRWYNNDAAEAFRNLRHRWFTISTTIAFLHPDQPGANPFFEFITRQYLGLPYATQPEQIVKNSK
jgi:hypothetical protein